MSEPLTALAVFAAIFAVAAVRNVPVGIVMLAAAFGVGALLADMTLEAVLDGFPLGTMIILAGVTYFFGVFVMAPIGMPLARRHGIDPMLMGVAIAAGGAPGAFAPTGLYFIITYGTTQDAGIALGPLTLFAVAVGATLAVVPAAFLAFRGRALLARRLERPATRLGIVDDRARAARARRRPAADGVLANGQIRQQRSAEQPECLKTRQHLVFVTLTC